MLLPEWALHAAEDYVDGEEKDHRFPRHPTDLAERERVVVVTFHAVRRGGVPESVRRAGPGSPNLDTRPFRSLA